MAHTLVATSQDSTLLQFFLSSMLLTLVLAMGEECSMLCDPERSISVYLTFNDNPSLRK